MHNIGTINYVFRRYLDIYRVAYGRSEDTVKKFYSGFFWDFYMKDTSIAYNIIFTPHFSCLPDAVTRTFIKTNKVLVLVIYFDDVNYYSSFSRYNLYSLNINIFINQFKLEILKQILNSEQKKILNVLKYDLNTKQTIVDQFIASCGLLTQSL